MSHTDFKLVKKKDLDDNTTLKITKNLMNGRLFVEFVSLSPKIVLQKNFENSMFGKIECDKFANSIKNIDDLKSYFGI